MSDRDFDKYIQDRESSERYRAAFEEYYGRDTKEERNNRIALEDGCAWVRIEEDCDENE